MDKHEHYVKAERLASEAAGSVTELASERLTALAQVHALLAIAAALRPTYRVEHVADLTPNPDTVAAIQGLLRTDKDV